jgi:hypothetical protein
VVAGAARSDTGDIKQNVTDDTFLFHGLLIGAAIRGRACVILPNGREGRKGRFFIRDDTAAHGKAAGRWLKETEEGTQAGAGHG